MAALIVFEFIISNHDHSIAHEPSFMETLAEIIKFLAVGTLIGIGAGFALFQLIIREKIPHYLLNVFTLALVLGVMIISHEVVHESGLVAVVAMGMFLAHLKVPHLDSILDFKEAITILLVSILFILLSANMDWEQLLTIDLKALALLAVIMLLVRPLGVILSTIGNKDLSFKDKFFIAWVGPRGIVAAGIASLLA